MHYSMSLLAEMLRAIGKNEEGGTVRKFMQERGVKKAYIHHFVENGTIKAPRQVPMVRALALGLVRCGRSESGCGKTQCGRDRKILQSRDGFLSTPFVLDVLAKYGYVDSAYRMLENTEAPGTGRLWLLRAARRSGKIIFPMMKNSTRKSCSMNHYSPGAICAFLFRTVCGIQVDGEKSFPDHTDTGRKLDRCGCRYTQSPYGKS